MTESKKNYKYTNKLINETSLYLLQHAHNPVNWYPWHDEALALARENNKLIFLSIGYSACHWCHVMEHESFESEEIAKILNEYFICIKVDREERPDIDEIYMSAVRLMTGQGGWPLSVWLTPDLQPFYGGTYFPPEDRWGRVGFKNLLIKIIDLWTHQPDQLLQSAFQITNNINQITQVQSSEDELGIDIWHIAAKKAKHTFDDQYGGFGTAPKFPQAMELSFLLRYYYHTGNEDARSIVEKTLQQMAKGGIYDHVGGGFHRYSTDEKWLVPHFEKMLYDNALLTITYLETYQITENIFYKLSATQTLDYVLREMTSPEGGFYSAQDADSEGEEGKYYVWEKNEIVNILGDVNSELFCNTYNVSQQGNWDGKNILHLARDFDFEKNYNVLENLTSNYTKLYEYRLKRTHPFKDTKILTAWNGLMISTMCKGYQVLRDRRFLTAAKKAIDFVLKNMYSNNNILRMYNKKQLQGYISDYSFLIAALLNYYETTFDIFYLEKASEINNLLLEKFWDNIDGGFYFTANDHEKLLVRTRNPYDNAIPSGNSVAVSNLLRIYEFTGDKELKDKAENTIKLYLTQVRKYPSGFAFLLSTFDFFWGKPKEIIIAGKSGSNKLEEFIEIIHKLYIPNKVIGFADSKYNNDRSDFVKEFPIFAGKFNNEEQGKVYVCENYTCKNPFKNKVEYIEYYNSIMKSEH